MRELTGWAGWPRSRAEVVEPTRPLRVPRHEGGVIARGLGRSYGDAALNDRGLVLDATALSGITAFDVERGRVTLGAGTRLADLLRACVPAGWFPSAVPGTRHVTIGGCLAADVHGKNHHRDGGTGDHVASLDLVTGSGERWTCSADERPDAFRATVGGMGLTGFIERATLELLPIETACMKVDVERATDLDDALARMASGDAAYRYSAAWVDLLAGGRRLGRSVLLRGDHAAADDVPTARRALAYRPRTWLAAPGWAPARLLSRTGVRAFNAAYFHRAPRSESGRLMTLTSFFHPLDAVSSWNRSYGPRGFLQYQLAVPLGAERSLARVVERLASARCPSFLTVLKRLGPAADRPLSFPLEGWTLSLDVPRSQDGVSALMAELDREVVEAGGRVYLAKDARLMPEMFRAMYPRFDEWLDVAATLDPDRLLRSDLARRLRIRQ